MTYALLNWPIKARDTKKPLNPFFELGSDHNKIFVLLPCKTFEIQQQTWKVRQQLKATRTP